MRSRRLGRKRGGILALGLALEIPAAELTELFSEHGEEIRHCAGFAGTGWLHTTFLVQSLKRYDEQILSIVRFNA